MRTDMIEALSTEELESLVGGFIKQGMDFVEPQNETLRFSRDTDFNVVFGAFTNEVSAEGIALIRKRILSENMEGNNCGAVLPKDFDTFKKILLSSFNEYGKTNVNK